MLSVQSISKIYGKRQVLTDVSFEVPDGQVTGFVGPNGSGKTTTLKIAMGLTRPQSGATKIDGKPIERWDHTATHVAAMLDQNAFHPRRKVRTTVRALARSQGIDDKRVDEVLNIVGLTQVAKTRIGALSLGMRQRLGIATVLLGDPRTLLFDEPVNGLDPEGVRWVRQLCKTLANEGRAVLISSHLLSEVAQTADRVVVLGKGKVLAADRIENLIGGAESQSVLVASPDRDGLREALRGLAVENAPEGALRVRGATSAEIGARCLRLGIVISQLISEQSSLEDAFLKLTDESVEYRSLAISEGTRLPQEAADPKLTQSQLAPNQAFPPSQVEDANTDTGVKGK